jgi:hypothetical protein
VIKQQKAQLKKKLSQFLPKYFKKGENEEEAPVMIIPSLADPKTLNGNISLSLASTAKNEEPKVYRSSTDYETVYLESILKDPIAQELLRFCAKVTFAHKLQVIHYMTTYCEALVAIDNKKQWDKALNKTIKKLVKLRLIQILLYSGEEKTHYDVPVLSLSGEGYHFVKHLRAQLSINYAITSPDTYLDKVPRAFVRSWAIVDVFLASVATKNFRGFESHFTGFTDEEERYDMPISNCVLTFETARGFKTTLFSYTYFEDDNPYYLKKAISGWRKIAQKYSSRPIPNFDGQVNLFAVIVQTRREAEAVSLKFGLNQLTYPPIIIVLEMMQDQSIEEAFVFWDSEGKLSRLHLTAKAPFKEKEKTTKNDEVAKEKEDDSSEPIAESEEPKQENSKPEASNEVPEELSPEELAKELAANEEPQDDVDEVVVEESTDDEFFEGGW